MRSCRPHIASLTLLVFCVLIVAGCHDQRVLEIQLRDANGRAIAGTMSVNSLRTVDSATSRALIPHAFREEEIVTIAASVQQQYQYKRLRISSENTQHVLFTFDVLTRPVISSAAQLFCDTVLVGQARTFLLALHNDGDAPFTVNTITLRGPSASQFALTSPRTFRVAPGQQTQIAVRFSPITEGTKRAELVVENNTEAQKAYRVPLTGWAIAASHEARIPPQIDSPVELDIGTVSVVESKSVACPVKNVGGDVLQVRRIRVQGPAASDFIADPPQQFAVSPGDEHSLTIRFSPTTEGEKSADVLLENNTGSDRVYRIRVHGRGARGSAVDIPALYAAGQQHYDSHRYDEAERVYTGLLASEPAEPLALYNRGRTRIALKKYDHAIQDFEAIRLYRSRINAADFEEVWYESWYFIARAVYEKYTEKANAYRSGDGTPSSGSRHRELEELRKLALVRIDDYLTLRNGNPDHVNHARAWRKDLSGQ